MLRLMPRFAFLVWMVTCAGIGCAGEQPTPGIGTPPGGAEGGPDGTGRTDGGGTTQTPDGGVPAGTCVGSPPEAFDPIATYALPALVATTVVTTTADSGPGSLRNAVNAGGVVGFATGLAGKTITLASTIEIAGAVTIDGSAAKGLTIDAARKGGAFHFNGDSPTRLAFFALRITNGMTQGSGGAISINGGSVDVEIGGVRFDANGAGEGGAVRIGYQSPRVFIHDSVFANNDGSLTGNGFSGGALSVSGGNLHVARCRFESNVGSTTGAVYAIHANPVVEDTVFVANRSAGNKGSGAFFSDGGGPGDYNNRDMTPGEITLRRSLFVRNRGAGDDGGAAELYAYPADKVTVEGCTFHANEAKPGRAGALFIHADKSVEILASVFADNHATGAGGAIWADGSALYRFENDLFSGNKSDSDLGGALRLNLAESAKLRIASSTFIDNTATSGNGALWLPGTRDVRVTNSIFASNTATGGAQQINFAVTNDGGNIEWPDPKTTSTLPAAKIADPKLGPLVPESSSFVRAPAIGSPAIDAAVSPVPGIDQRGARRVGKADIGSLELGATCTPR